jgi:hypothetical protein
MTDYTKAVTNGTMMIRDTGSVVEFWFQTSSSTFNHDQTWGYQVGSGTYQSRTFDLVAGGGWQKFGSVTVSTSVDVRFRIDGSGLGWPTTDFTQAISRATVPPAPDAVVLTAVTNVKVHAEFVGNGNGGLPITEWQIGYGTHPTTAQLTRTGFDIDITGLTPGTTYYFWARGGNSLGWGPWSPRSSVKTDDVPPAPDAPVLTEVTQVSVKSTFTGNGNGGSDILEWQLGYGLVPPPTDPTTKVTSGGGINTVTNLSPGLKYYFWARGRNVYGWGPWSPTASVTLIAGAMVNQGGTWKRAVPYVRVAGVWKVARPWVKSAGVWKETST